MGRGGGLNVYTISYADNTVLVAENEVEMRSIIGRMEEYLDKRGLELNK